MIWLSDARSVCSHLQLASNGQWEKALSIGPLTAPVFEDWLIDAGGNVAIEAVYLTEEGRLRGFFGFRRQIEDEHERHSFWGEALALSRSGQCQPPSKLLSVWLDLLGAREILRQKPEEFQLGVFNRWLTDGPVTLENGKLRVHDLEQGPHWLKRGAVAPICRERIWWAPERIWVAEVVSFEADGIHFLNRIAT